MVRSVVKGMVRGVVCLQMRDHSHQPGGYGEEYGEGYGEGCGEGCGVFTNERSLTPTWGERARGREGERARG